MHQTQGLSQHHSAEDASQNGGRGPKFSSEVIQHKNLSAELHGLLNVAMCWEETCLPYALGTGLIQHCCWRCLSKWQLGASLLLRSTLAQKLVIRTQWPFQRQCAERKPACWTSQEGGTSQHYCWRCFSKWLSGTSVLLRSRLAQSISAEHSHLLQVVVLRGNLLALHLSNLASNAFCALGAN